MPPTYSPVDFDLWPIFGRIDNKSILQRVVLLHVFGDEGRSAIFITENDSVYAIGANDLGRLGIRDVTFTEQPIEIPFLCRRKIICFTSGSVHTLALSENGELFSWGNNTLGRLGNGTILDKDTPGRVLLPEGEHVKAVSCSDRYSLALTFNNKVLHWGDIQFSSCTGQNIPCVLEFPDRVIVSEIACGGFHAAALSAMGEVYTWGGNSLGQLGQEMDNLHPLLLRRSPKSGRAIAIGCGLLTTVILNENGNFSMTGYFSSHELRCPPIKEFVICNMDHLICMKCEDEKLYCFGNFGTEDDESNEPQGMDLTPLSGIRNMQSAFGGRATPQFLRASPKDLELESLVEEMQGPLRDIATLFDRKESSDLTVKLSDGIVHVHKLIMVTFSEHFKAMLLGSWGSEAKKELDMQNYNPKAYRAFLKFIYSGKLEPLQGNELIDLYDIAQSYFEHELKEMSVSMFGKRLKPENTALLFSLAYKGQCTELMELCYVFGSAYLDEIIMTEGYDNLTPELGKMFVKEATKRKKKNI